MTDQAVYRIKPLEWKQFWTFNDWSATTPFGLLRVRQFWSLTGGTLWYWSLQHHSGTAISREHAQAAAQRCYRELLLTALECALVSASHECP